MPSFKITEIINETFSFIKREIRLIAPVVLSTIGFSNLVMFFLSIEKKNINPLSSAMPHQGYYTLLLLFCTFLNIVGYLTLSRLTAVSGETVKQALSLALRRVISVFVFLFTLSLIFTFVLLSLLIIGNFLSRFLGNTQILTQPAFLYPAISLGLIVTIAILIKFSFWYVIMMTDKASPFQAARYSFQITKGLFWRLILVMMPFAISSYAASMAYIFAHTHTLKIIVGIIGCILNAAIVSSQVIFLAIIYNRLKSKLFFYKNR